MGYDTETPKTENNLQFELVNVLFNVGALYSYLGVAENRNTSDGLRKACSYFQNSAGCFAHLEALKSNLVVDLGPSLDEAVLSTFESLMLAQAQECFWQKAILDGLSDSSIARLAAKVSSLYFTTLDVGSTASIMPSEWIVHVSAKGLHFEGAAQWRAACDALGGGKYGEEIARLQKARAACATALERTTYLKPDVIRDLQGLDDVVRRNLVRAEKDNDMIYLSTVPIPADLPAIRLASMVNPTAPPQITAPPKDEKMLFSKLVPFAVYLACRVWRDRADRVIEGQKQALDAQTNELRSQLKTLHLPGSLQALEGQKHIPASLLAHADDVRAKGGLQTLLAIQRDVQILAKRCAAAMAEAQVYEVNTEMATQQRHLSELVSAAHQGDETVDKKLGEWQGLIKLVGSSEDEIEAYIPAEEASSTLDYHGERDLQTLRGLLHQCTQLEEDRRDRIDAKRRDLNEQVVKTALLAKAATLPMDTSLSLDASAFEDVIAGALKELNTAEPDERSLQTKLMQEIEETNAVVFSSRERNSSQGGAALGKREKSLQRLELGYENFREISRNLEEGRNFYNALLSRLDGFVSACRRVAAWHE